MNDNVFIQKFGYTLSSIIFLFFNFYSFSGVICGYYNVWITYIYYCQFDWPHEIQTSFHKRFKGHHKFEWSLATPPYWPESLATVTSLVHFNNVLIKWGHL
jgi:hypothetical protein